MTTKTQHDYEQQNEAKFTRTNQSLLTLNRKIYTNGFDTILTERIKENQFRPC